MKTIYLLHSRPGKLMTRGTLAGNEYPGATIAFECKECAEVQAAWFRRDKVPVAVIPVTCYAHMRDAQTHDCAHVKLARPGRNSEHEHIPMTLNAQKTSTAVPDDPD